MYLCLEACLNIVISQLMFWVSFLPPLCCSSWYLPNRFHNQTKVSVASLVAHLLKKSACSRGDQSSIPGSGSSPREGNGYPLQYSCLENPMDRGAWQATVYRVAKNRTRLSEYTTTEGVCSNSGVTPNKC